MGVLQQQKQNKKDQIPVNLKCWNYSKLSDIIHKAYLLKKLNHKQKHRFYKIEQTTVLDPHNSHVSFQKNI